MQIWAYLDKKWQLGQVPIVSHRRTETFFAASEVTIFPVISQERLHLPQLMRTNEVAQSFLDFSFSLSLSHTHSCSSLSESRAGMLDILPVGKRAKITFD